MEQMLLPKSNQSMARKANSILNTLADICLLALQGQFYQLLLLINQ